MAVKVALFPQSPLDGDDLAAWVRRELRVQLPPEALRGKPRTLPVVKGDRAAGELEAVRLMEEHLDGLRTLRVSGRWNGRPVAGGVAWEEAARAFDLEDTPHHLWRARALPEAGLRAWQGDLRRLALEEHAWILERDAVVVRLEPTETHAWACWLAAWRLGDRVGLDLGLRQERLRSAFQALRERLPGLPEEVFARSREAADWGKGEMRRLRQAS
ncbi:MAG: hypothetical protein KatS3mg071_1994 [Meiothermus sp.]|nr:MAG: hypothetical protein KatS3mg071_1994 [Meiothermus sp.]